MAATSDKYREKIEAEAEATDNLTDSRPRRTYVKYSLELVMPALEKLAQGYTLRQACVGEEFDRHAIYRWARRYPELRKAWEHALDMQTDVIEDQILDIADNSRNDWIEIESKSGNTYRRVNDEAVRRSTLRLETRWRILASRRPDKYGRKLDVTSKGDSISELGTALVAAAMDMDKGAEQRNTVKESAKRVRH